MLQLKTSFLRKSRRMIRDLWLSRFETSNPTPTGPIRIFEDPTNNLTVSPSPPRSRRNSDHSLEELENMSPVGESFLWVTDHP